MDGRNALGDVSNVWNDWRFRSTFRCRAWGIGELSGTVDWCVAVEGLLPSASRFILKREWLAFTLLILGALVAFAKC